MLMLFLLVIMQYLLKNFTPNYFYSSCCLYLYAIIEMLMLLFALNAILC